MQPILQTTLPYDAMAPRVLPGIQPLEMQDWLLRDDAFDAQMAARDHLLHTARPDVLAMDAGARAAADELLDLVLELAYPASGDKVARPDGVKITINRDDPLGTLGRLVQEDLCILQKTGDEHVLTGAVLCFPASWMLSQKFMRSLIDIHAPVEGYDKGIAARVQRMFDGVQPDRPLWRFNALWYQDPTLHQPRDAHAPRLKTHEDRMGYLRSERQCILRLRKSRAVIFSIHTYVLPRAAVAGVNT